MRSALSGVLPGAGRPYRARVVVLVAVVVAHLLVLALVLFVRMTGPILEPEPRTMLVFPVEEPAPVPDAPQQAEQADAVPPPPSAIRVPVIDAPAPPAPSEAPALLDLEFDLAKVAPSADAPVQVADSADTGQDIKQIYGPVLGRQTAPGGQPLYNAEWQVEPTRAQLAYYMPDSGVPAGSWAMIGCRTVAQFRVEDCFELEQSPVGSGLSAALRKAAWQFRVRPPRIGGKVLVGSWVRIRIDFTNDGVK